MLFRSAKTQTTLPKAMEIIFTSHLENGKPTLTLIGSIHAFSEKEAADGLKLMESCPVLSKAKFNRAAIEEKVVRLARWLNLRVPTFDGFMQWTLDLRREVGIPHTLAELGVKAEHLDKFSEMAAVDPTAGGNPIKVGAADMRKMYEASVAGRL